MPGDFVAHATGSFHRSTELIDLTLSRINSGMERGESRQKFASVDCHITVIKVGSDWQSRGVSPRRSLVGATEVMVAAGGAAHFLQLLDRRRDIARAELPALTA